MAYDSFGHFVQVLEKAGQLERVRQPVATELEITELADREMKSPGGGKALLIEQPTVNGQVSPFPLAINVFGSHSRMALSLGVSSVEVLAAELGSLLKAKPPRSLAEAIKLLATALDLRHAKPKLVAKGPCQEVVHQQSQLTSGAAGSCPTLLSLPILKCWPLDAGRFITLPCVVT
jgi:4-hydroxy-3-polyprenylbenzoate decarboxylase